jgi:hypothetical protein
MSDQVQPEPSTDPYDELEANTRRDIDQLIDQGCLSEGFTYGGHSFVVRTLRPNESNAVALVTKGMIGTLREAQAFMQATIGLSLFSLDGDPDFHKRIGDLITHAAKRYEWVGENLDDVTIATVYKRYDELDRRRIAARQALTNLPAPGQSQSTPWPGSSTGRDTFSDGAPTEIPYSLS